MNFMFLKFNTIHKIAKLILIFFFFFIEWIQIYLILYNIKVTITFSLDIIYLFNN